MLQSYLEAMNYSSDDFNREPFTIDEVPVNKVLFSWDDPLYSAIYLARKI